VDNDPHFVLNVAGLKEAVCFDVDGRPGSIYQLIYDKVTGTTRPVRVPPASPLYLISDLRRP